MKGRELAERLLEGLEDGVRADGTLGAETVAALRALARSAVEDYARGSRLKHRCHAPGCGLRFEWPGQLDEHQRRTGHDAAAVRRAA